MPINIVWYTSLTHIPPLSSCHLFPDIQTLEWSAQEYTAEHVGHFLEEIGLGHHVATFIEQDISGDMLLEADEEVLMELGVTNATDKLKIKVYMEGGGVQMS